MLGIGIVHRNHGKAQNLVFGHTAQTNDARGRLLRAPHNARNEFLFIRQNSAHQIGTVIHGDLRSSLQCGVKVGVISLIVFPPDGKDGDFKILHQRGCRVILSAERVGGADSQLSTPSLESAGQISGLGRHMETGRNANSLQRLFLFKPFPNQPQDRHGLVCPFNPVQSLWSQRRIFNIEVHGVLSLKSCCSGCSE